MKSNPVTGTSCSNEFSFADKNHKNKILHETYFFFYSIILYDSSIRICPREKDIHIGRCHSRWKQLF